MNKIKKKILTIVLAVLFCFCAIGQVDANNDRLVFVGADYDENDVFVITFTFNGFEDPESGETFTRATLGYQSHETRYGGILGIGQTKTASYDMRFSHPVYYGGDCIMGEPDMDTGNFDWNYNADWAIAVDVGNYCSVAFKQYGSTVAQGFALTRDELGDPPFFETYNLPYWVNAYGGMWYDSGWQGMWYGGSAFFPQEVYDLIPWGEIPEPPEPDPIAGECGTPNEQVYIGSEGLPELEDLCSVGELDSLIAVPVGDFNIFTYKCLGEHGGDDASCGFYQYTGTGQPGEPSPACGSADGKVYHYPLEPDPDHLCAFGEVQGYQYNAETHKWNWRCSRGNFSAWCSASRAYDFDLPEIDFEEWEFDFEEGETSKNWLVEIFKFVFLPKDSTIESFLNNFNELKTKIPLGYLDLILNKFKDVDIQEKQVILELDIFGTDVEVWNIEEFKEEHSGLWNIVQGMLEVAIWFVFLVYIFHRARSIFNNSE